MMGRLLLVGALTLLMVTVQAEKTLNQKLELLLQLLETAEKQREVREKTDPVPEIDVSSAVVATMDNTLSQREALSRMTTYAKRMDKNYKAIWESNSLLSVLGAQDGVILKRRYVDAAALKKGLEELVSDKVISSAAKDKLTEGAEKLKGDSFTITVRVMFNPAKTTFTIKEEKSTAPAVKAES